jgi:hypothetical protein
MTMPEPLRGAAVATEGAKLLGDDEVEAMQAEEEDRKRDEREKGQAAATE